MIVFTIYHNDSCYWLFKILLTIILDGSILNLWKTTTNVDEKYLRDRCDKYMVKNETYIVEGMSCASCAAHIEESLKQVDDLSDVNVNFATSKLTLSRGEGIDRTEVEKIVEKSGYKLTYVSSIEERTFN